MDSGNAELRYQRDQAWQAEQARFQGLIHRTVAVYCPQSDIDYGDYLSAAYTGLERALLRANTPVLLPGFARVCIVNAVIDFHRKRRRRLAVEQLDDTL